MNLEHSDLGEASVDCVELVDLGKATTETKGQTISPAWFDGYGYQYFDPA